MILVADAGGTSTKWGLVRSASGDWEIFATSPINVSIMSESDIITSLRQCEEKLAADDAEGNHALYFYAAGLNSEKTLKKLEQCIAQDEFLIKFSFRCSSDLEGAAFALFGSEPGIACILGTGSASGFYAGEKIAKSVPSLGYILGDEGSGAAMGKMLLNRYFKGGLSVAVSRQFKEFCPLEVPEVIENVYRRPGANTFLASMVPFLKTHESESEIAEIIEECLKLFFEINVLKYNRESCKRIGFSGGVANAFRDRLEALSHSYGFEKIVFTDSPINEICRRLRNEM